LGTEKHKVMIDDFVVDEKERSKRLLMVEGEIAVN
jgi:hypothetical protein